MDVFFNWVEILPPQLKAEDLTTNKPRLTVKGRVPIQNIGNFDKVKIITDINYFNFFIRFLFSKTFGDNKLDGESLTEYLTDKVELFEDSNPWEETRIHNRDIIISEGQRYLVRSRIIFQILRFQMSIG